MVLSEAETVLNAIDEGRSIAPFSASDGAFDEARAYAVGRQIVERRRARGENPVGRKIGFTNSNIWPQFNVFAPIWGTVYDSTVSYAKAGAARVPLGRLLEPHIEPEIVLHFARKPPLSQDPEAILASVDWIAHGFEIVQSPFPGWKFAAPDTIAGVALHGKLIVGEPVAVASIADCAHKLATFRIALARDGEAQVEGGGANVLGSPLLAFAHLSTLLASQPSSPPVEAGEIVTTGTLTDALPVRPGQTWSTKIEGIELPGLTVTFT